MKNISKLAVIAFVVIMLPFVACKSGGNSNEGDKAGDTTVVAVQDTSKQVNQTDTLADNNTQITENKAKVETPTVLIYNFHVTNRCPSCIAIEDATTKTLKTYFAAELKQGRIKRQVLNVDDEANSKIAEKYEAFGSGCFVTRVYKGKETTTDLTGDGFKYAKNKEERFIEILKNKISEYLK